MIDHLTDNSLLDQLGEVKLANKRDLTYLIKQKTGIAVSPNAIFDVQIKRLHAYKRQLLNLLRIIKLYLDLKQNPDLEIIPRVFISVLKLLQATITLNRLLNALMRRQI
nr:phosphorylase [uncultured Clostridium sp.]